MNSNVKKLASMGVLMALSIALVTFIHLPIIPAAPFLEYDPADIPILIGTFVYGPVAGLVMTVIVSVIQGLTVSAQSGLYGILMHIVATGSYVLVAGLIYKVKKTRWGAGVAIVVASIVMVAVMAGANLIITPLFMGMPIDAVKGMLLPAIVPFNALKAGINGAVTFIVYKRVADFLRKDAPLKKGSGSHAA